MIDSDEKIPVLIPEILQQQGKNAALPSVEQPEADLQAASLEEEFQSGLNVVNMDDLLQQEKEKMSEEFEEQSRLKLAEAQRQAEEIVQKARDEAERICQNALEEGKRQGIEEGLAAARSQMEQERESFEQQMQQKQEEWERDIAELEPQIADIITALVEKLVGIKCQDHKDVLVYLIDRALHHLERAESITVRVSQEDLLAVSSQKERILEAAGEAECNLVEDGSLASGQCIIETENKMIDCSLDVQLQSLAEQIKLLTAL